MNLARSRRQFAGAILLTLATAAQAAALDYVTIKQGEGKKELAGSIEVEAADGGVLLQSRDGVLWPIKTEEIVSRRSDSKPFTPFSRDELASQLTAEYPGFKIYKTQRYLIAYNTSPAYAQWVGSLFERLHAAFYNYWTRSGAVLHESKFPLVAVVFDSQESYALHAQREIGEATSTIIGYYSMATNRMTMYDLTGVEQAAGGRSSPDRINQILSQPQAERTVATIVHEATHQIAFNSGLQVRFTEMPFWVSEGIAIFFETPDLKSSKGWSGIGKENFVNLAQFRQYLGTRKPGSLEQFLADDKRFRDSATSANAYAEAWAFNYFLLRTRKPAYVKYLKTLSEQTPLLFLEPPERLKQFQQFFGDNLTGLEAEFLQYMRKVN